MARGTVTPEAIEYPDSDGLPMAESEFQFWPILYVGTALDCYFQARDDVYVVGNLLLYYQEGDPGKSVSPDLMVVMGAPKHIRSSYRLWDEPKAPDFVLEIASESTCWIDRGAKREIYASMGVLEYWQCDPAGSYLVPPLLGFRLVGGHYVEIPVASMGGDTLTATSEVLGLEFRLRPEAPLREALHFYDPMRGEYLRTYRETCQALEEAQARWDAKSRLEQTQDRLREAQTARQALEAELRELRQRGR